MTDRLNYRDDLNSGKLSANTVLNLPVYTVGTLPTAGIRAGSVVYCSDGNAGSPDIVHYSGSAWLATATGATAATS
jgi:hypothetical protein